MVNEVSSKDYIYVLKTPRIMNLYFEASRGGLKITDLRFGNVRSYIRWKIMVFNWKIRMAKIRDSDNYKLV
jgi:hypothetical protein